MAKDEMGMASGHVSWLSDGANEFPVIVPSGDTDMVTIGIGALTSTKGNEVIVSQLNVDELRGDARSRGLFEARINKLLGRNDLKVVQLLRAEESSPCSARSPWLSRPDGFADNPPALRPSRARSTSSRESLTNDTPKKGRP